MENIQNTDWKEKYQNMTFSQIISCSWNILLKNSKILILANLIAAIIVWFLNSDIFFNLIIPNTDMYSNESLHNIKNILSLSGEFLNGLFYILFFYLYYIAVIKNEQNKKIQLKDIKNQKNYLSGIFILNFVFLIFIFFPPVFIILKARPDLSIFDYRTFLKIYDFYATLKSDYAQFSPIISLRTIISYSFVYVIGLGIILDFSIISMFETNSSIFQNIKNSILIYLKNIFTIMLYFFGLILIFMLISLITLEFTDFILEPLVTIFTIILYKKLIIQDQTCA